MTVEPAPVVRDRGAGRPILVVHGGMSDEWPWIRVADTMVTRHRVVLLRRRLYRLDLPSRPERAMTDQVAEVLKVARGLGQPCVVVGHSSGAIIALEALAADPSPFAGGVLYEPPAPLTDLPIGKPTTLPRARAALARGRVGRAMQIFLHDAVQVSPWVSALTPAMTLLPGVRRYVPRQIDDLESIVALGVRSDAYADIDRPLWFLTGETSPTHLRQRCERLAANHPRAGLITLPGVGHGANQSRPRQMGDLLCHLADLMDGASTH
jgi:pimeloyl-ACP methyl ester carboxylesterase